MISFSHTRAREGRARIRAERWAAPPPIYFCGFDLIDGGCGRGV
jgi:hypothetical protein